MSIDSSNYPELVCDRPFHIEYSKMYGFFYACDICNASMNDFSYFKVHRCRCGVHTFEAVYKTIHVDEVGHYEQVLVKDAYDEVVYVNTFACNGCGQTFASASECLNHSMGVHEEDKGSMQSTSESTVHHDAQYDNVWVVDKAGYDTQEIEYYLCTVCGEKQRSI